MRDANAQSVDDALIHADALRRYFTKRVPVAEVDDLMQDVFLKMHAREATTPIANLQGYVFRVASTVLADRHARTRRAGEMPAHETATSITPERQLIARQDAELVIEALGRLPVRTRQIFLLHRLDGQSYAEIASQFGLSASSIEKHMMKAIAHIVRARHTIMR